MGRPPKVTDWRPTAPPTAIEARARLLALLRDWFAERGVLEVETPALSGAGNSDPGIDQIQTRVPSGWLRTSPEYAMKRLLAAGSPDIYELGRVFRKGEAGARHNPEFTLLEWYRLGWAYTELMTETASLVQHCGRAFGRDWSVEEHSYRDLFATHTGLDPLTCGVDDLANCAAQQAIALTDAASLDRDGWLDLLMSHVVQPRLRKQSVYLVRDYPASQAALARIRADEPPVAERFEVYVGPMELANGYQELTDAAEQRDRFAAERNRRAASNRPAPPLDERLLAALDKGLPECSGVALGVDRLLMACLGVRHISEVIAFPIDRA